MKDFKPKSINIFRDIKSGVLQIEDNISWKYVRHGIGVQFTSISGEVVDAHVGMVEYPEAFDACRILQFLESIAVTRLQFNGTIYEIDFDDEKSVRRVLSEMTEAGVLERFIFNDIAPHPLYRIRESNLESNRS
jgi:hypothetical protein